MAYIIYRRPPTLKSSLAPSRLIQHKSTICKDAIKGIFRCTHARCLCCKEIAHKITSFKSTTSGENFSIKHHLTCRTSYVIYMIQCIFGKQYVGRTTQELHNRINQHRANIKKGFWLHGLSRHCTQHHQGEVHPFKVFPIDHIASNVHNRFEQLKKREVYWIYRLKTLQPCGLNEVSEIIV